MKKKMKRYVNNTNNTIFLTFSVFRNKLLMTLNFIRFKLKTQILSKQHPYINLKFNLHKLEQF